MKKAAKPTNTTRKATGEKLSKLIWIADKSLNHCTSFAGQREILMSFLDGGILGCELMSELGPSAKISANEGLSAIGRLFTVYLFVAVFWSLWDQSSGGEWTLQARNLNLHFLGLKLLPEQVQVANPLLILALVPLFNYLLYPAVHRFFLSLRYGR